MSESKEGNSQFPTVVFELIYGVQKLFELGPDQEVPDAELIAELEEILPRLPNTLDGKVRKLVGAAKVIVTNARNMETLDAREMHDVARTLKHFENVSMGAKAKILRSKSQVVKGEARKENPAHTDESDDA